MAAGFGQRAYFVVHFTQQTTFKFVDPSWVYRSLEHWKGSSWEGEGSVDGWRWGRLGNISTDE